MDVDLELEQVQVALCQAEKEVEVLGAELRRKVSEVDFLQKRELSLLQQQRQKLLPVPGGGGGLLVAAVWENSSSGDVESVDGEEGQYGVQCSTQEMGCDTQIQFSQPISDISVSEERVKVSRGEALKRDRAVTRKEAAESNLCQFLNIDQVDLTSEDLEEFENSIAMIGNKLGYLQKTAKKKKKVERPDDTFLSSSMFEALKQKVNAKKAATEEEVDDRENLSGDLVSAGEDLEEQEGGEVNGESATGGRMNRGYYKAFTDLVPLSKDMKTRAAPLHARLSEWCNLNRCSKVAALGYLLHSLFYNEDKTLAGLGLKLFTQGKEAILVNDVPYLVALWLVERLRLGRGRYTECRLLLLR